MTWRQSHLRKLADVPRADDQSARVWIGLDLIDHLTDLIDRLAVGRSPRSPLRPVDRTQFAILIGPLVPNVDAMVLKILDVGVAAQKPKELVDDRLYVQLLGGQNREAFRKIKSHLIAEHRAGAGSCAI